MKYVASGSRASRFGVKIVQHQVKSRSARGGSVTAAVASAAVAAAVVE
jgi:hypothetical protein